MPIYTCEKCNKKFKAKGDYTRHIKRKFPCTPENNKEQPVLSVEKIRYKCSYCKQTFTRNASLKRHIDGRCHEKKTTDFEKLVQTVITNQENMNKEYKEIKKDYEEFNNEIQILRNENQILRNENQKLKKSNQTLRSYNEKYIEIINNS